MLLFQCSLFGLIVLHFLGRTNGRKRLIISGLISFAMLWGMQLVSGIFLTRFPHYAAGFERLRWFVYPIALCVTTALFDMLACTMQLRRVITAAALGWIIVASMLYRADIESPLARLRGINSLLDYETAAHQQRRRALAEIDPGRDLESLRPNYLRPDDRALLIDSASTKHYWLTRRGSFWSDPYVEGFALYHRGDEFLRDREVFYNLLDRRDVDGLADWLERKQITLWIDFEPDAGEFVGRIEKQHPIDFEQVAPEAWRVKRNVQ